MKTMLILSKQRKSLRFIGEKLSVISSLLFGNKDRRKTMKACTSHFKVILKIQYTIYYKYSLVGKSKSRAACSRTNFVTSSETFR